MNHKGTEDTEEREGKGLFHQYLQNRA